MNQLLKDLNTVHNYYMDKNDIMKTKRDMDIFFLRLPEECHDFLTDLLRFIMFSRMVSETTKIYLRGTDRTREATFKRYNLEHPDKPINLNTAKSKVNYDRNKLLEYFDDDMISQITNNPGTCDLPKYRRSLARADARFGKIGTFNDHLILNLKCTEYAKTVDIDRFDEFLTLLAPYRREVVKLREKLLREDYHDVLSYINFLCSGSQMTEVDKANLINMMSYLRCQETEPDDIGISIDDIDGWDA